MKSTTVSKQQVIGFCVDVNWCAVVGAMWNRLVISTHCRWWGLFFFFFFQVNESQLCASDCSLAWRWGLSFEWKEGKKVIRLVLCGHNWIGIIDFYDRATNWLPKRDCASIECCLGKVASHKWPFQLERWISCAEISHEVRIYWCIFYLQRLNMLPKKLYLEHIRKNAGAKKKKESLNFLSRRDSNIVLSGSFCLLHISSPLQKFLCKQWELLYMNS